MLKAFISDWNGTILNDFPVAYGAVVATFEHFGISPVPTPSQYRDEITSNFMEFYRAHGIPPSAPAEEINGVRREYFEKHAAEIKLHQGAHLVLQTCRAAGIKTAIVSAEVDSILQEMSAKFDIKPHSDVVIGSVWGKEGKGPTVTKILKSFGIAPGEALYLDDSAEGLASIKELGVRVAGFAGGYNSVPKLRSATPDVVSSFTEVWEMLSESIN